MIPKVDLLQNEERRTNETLWTEAERILHMTIGIGTSADSSLTVDVLFEATSFVSSASGSQKNENSEVVFLHEGTGDMMIFVGDPN